MRPAYTPEISVDDYRLLRFSVFFFFCKVQCIGFPGPLLVDGVSAKDGEHKCEFLKIGKRPHSTHRENCFNAIDNEIRETFNPREIQVPRVIPLCGISRGNHLWPEFIATVRITLLP